MPDPRFYDELVMDHIRNARNFRVPDRPGRVARQANPLCGDEVEVSIALEGGRIADIGFQCTCCGIAMASASIMTERVKGRGAGEAAAVARETLLMVNGELSVPAADPERGALLDTVRRFPTRTRCATLAWTALEAALRDAG